MAFKEENLVKFVQEHDIIDNTTETSFSWSEYECTHCHVHFIGNIWSDHVDSEIPDFCPSCGHQIDGYTEEQK